MSTWDESKHPRDDRGRFARALAHVGRAVDRAFAAYEKNSRPGTKYHSLFIKDRFTRLAPPGSGRDLAVKLTAASMGAVGIVFGVPAGLVKTAGMWGAAGIGLDNAARWTARNHPSLFSNLVSPTEKVPTSFRPKSIPRR